MLHKFLIPKNDFLFTYTQSQYFYSIFLSLLNITKKKPLNFKKFVIKTKKYKKFIKFLCISKKIIISYYIN